MFDIQYSTDLPGGAHWSFRMRRGTALRMTDISGGSNVGMMLYNPENLLEKYNAPDTLKCQHTFKLTHGHCLHSDMGRVFASIVQDSVGWHETMCGNSRAADITQQYGARDYQNDRNNWHQNGHDAFLVELTKYGMSSDDLASNVNWFNKVSVDTEGRFIRAANHSAAGDTITLRFEMDTLVVVHTCPHPLASSNTYPANPVRFELGTWPPPTGNDACRMSCEENQRAFRNTELYYLGAQSC